jgi:hypothetical protein
MTLSSTQAPDSVDLLRHLALERISSQWAGFLGVLSEELQAQLSEGEYRALLVRLGGRFAQTYELPACGSLSDIEAAANKVWSQCQWGFVVFSEVGRQLQIAHHACPLPAALQVDSDLAAGFMEGVYATWLLAAGSPDELQLSQLPDGGQPMLMVFKLSAR